METIFQMQSEHGPQHEGRVLVHVPEGREPAAATPLHVIIVCQVFFPDEQSTSQLLTDLLLRLEGVGHHFTVIAGYPAMHHGPVPPRREKWQNLEILRTGVSIDYKRSLLGRALHYFFFLAGSSLELLKRRRCSLVVGVSNPPFSPIWLCALTRLSGQKYQLLLHDIYPDGLVGVGSLKPWGYIARLWSAANRIAFKRAERITVLGRDMVTLLETGYAVPREKIDYVPHWSLSSGDNSLSAEHTLLYGKLGMEGRFIVQYSGNMGLWHDIDMIVKAAALLRDQPEIHFLMIGDGVRRTQARQLAQQFQLRNMTWLPYRPKAELADSLACCHLALISQRSGLLGVAVPCKLYGILGSGRAILAMVPFGSEVGMVVQEEKCGLIVEPGDPSGLASAILELKNDRALTTEMGKRAYLAAQQKYNLAAAAKKFQVIWRQPDRLEPNEILS